MTWIVRNLWLIPALPALAAGLSALAKQRNRRSAASLAIGSMGLSFLLSLWAFANTLSLSGQREAAIQVFNFPWLQYGSEWLKLGWMLDPLTAVMLVMVSFSMKMSACPRESAVTISPPLINNPMKRLHASRCEAAHWAAQWIWIPVFSRYAFIASQSSVTCGCSAES